MKMSIENKNKSILRMDRTKLILILSCFFYASKKMLISCGESYESPFKSRVKSRRITVVEAKLS